MTYAEARDVVVAGDIETFVEALRIMGIHRTCWPALLRWREDLLAGRDGPPPPCFRGRAPRGRRRAA